MKITNGQLKDLKAINSIREKGKYREELMNVLVKDGRLVASNGYILAECRFSSELADGVYSVKIGRIPKAGGYELKDGLLFDDNGAIVGSIIVQPDLEWPNYKAIMPTDDYDPIFINLDLNYLISLLKLYKSLGHKEIEMRVPIDKGRAVILESGAIKSLIMPRVNR